MNLDVEYTNDGIFRKEMEPHHYSLEDKKKQENSVVDVMKHLTSHVGLKTLNYFSLAKSGYRIYLC